MKTKAKTNLGQLIENRARAREAANEEAAERRAEEAAHYRRQQRQWRAEELLRDEPL